MTVHADEIFFNKTVAAYHEGGFLVLLNKEIDETLHLKIRTDF